MALEKKLELKQITKMLGPAISKGAVFEWLDPP